MQTSSTIAFSSRSKIGSGSRIKVGLLNASYLTMGKVISQAIGLVAFFYVARALGPQNYGIYATVTAFVGFFQLFTFTGLSRVIIREGSKSLSNLHKVLETTVGLRLFFILIAVLLCCISSAFTGYSNLTKVLIVLFSLELAEIGINSFLGTIYQTTEKMKYLAYFAVMERTLFATLSITFLYLGFGLLTIVLLNLFSKLCISLTSFVISRRLVKFRFRFSLHGDKKILKAAFIFSLIAFVHTLATRIDILMISFLSTPEDVGIYSIAFKISREGSMLRGAIATAFFPIIVKYFSTNTLKAAHLIKYSTLFLTVSLLSCLILSYFVQDLVVLIFGDKYLQSGSILKYLLFYSVFSFYSIPFTLAMQATHNEKIMLIISIVMVFFNIPLNIVLFNQFGLVGIAYSTLIVYSTGNILLSLLTYKKLKHQGHII